MKMFFEYVVLNNEEELIYFARRIERVQLHLYNERLITF